jgi:hypothetical protein
VVAAVCGCAEQLHLRLHHFTISPAWGDPPRYELLVEEPELHTPAEGRRLAHKVDRRLQELNCEYREKRTSGRLAAVACQPMPAGTWKRLAAERLRSLGGSIEQYKHPCLVPELDFATRLLSAATKPAPLAASGSPPPGAVESALPELVRAQGSG